MDTYICKQCGKEVKKGLPTCPHCGAALGTTMGQPQMKPTDFKSKDTVNSAQAMYFSDNGSFGWIVLGLFLPPVGIILYFLKRKKSPHAKAALISAIVSLFIILAICLVTGVFNQKKHLFYEWVDYSDLLGKDKATVLEEIEKKHLWGRETGNELVIEKKEEVEKGHRFGTELWFSEDGHLSAVTKGYSGRIDESQTFVVNFYKQLIKLYGKPDQPPETFKYDTWEQFYDGMVEISSSKDEKRSLLAVWKDQQVAVNFEVYDGKVTIQYNQFNEADWPGWMP